MTLIVDASVVAKWVIREEHSDRARAISLETSLIAPVLIGAELGNALWKAVRRGRFSGADAVTGLKTALSVLTTVPNEDLNARALEIAVMLDHPIYDCFYLALAEREPAPLITADKRLLKVGKRLKGLEIRPL